MIAQPDYAIKYDFLLSSIYNIFLLLNRISKLRNSDKIQDFKIWILMDC